MKRGGSEILNRGGASGRGRATGSAAAGLPASVGELGEALRRAREERGLDISTAAGRTGLPEGQLRALETGAVEWIPDHVHVLTTLRRYADFLGLPGDHFVVVLVDNWPLAAHPPLVPLHEAGGRRMPGAGGNGGRETDAPSTRASDPDATTPLPDATTPVPDATTGLLRAVGPAGAASPAVPAAGAATRAVRTVHAGPALPAAWLGPGLATGPATAQVPVVMPATGVVRAVEEPDPRRLARPPLGLRLVVALVALALVAGVAGLVVDHLRPQWLRDIGVTSATSPGPARATSPLPASAHPTGSRQAPPRQPPPAGAVTEPAASPHLRAVTGIFHVAPNGPAGATATIRSSSFVVRVIAEGGSSWIQATDAQHVTPIFTGTLGPGQSQTFKASRALTVQVGAAAAHLYVAVRGKLAGYVFPPAAPFTFTFRSVH